MTLAFAAALPFGAGVYLLLQRNLLRVVAGIVLISDAVPPFAGGRP